MSTTQLAALPDVARVSDVVVLPPSERAVSKLRPRSKKLRISGASPFAQFDLLLTASAVLQYACQDMDRSIVGYRHRSRDRQRYRVETNMDLGVDIDGQIVIEIDIGVDSGTDVLIYRYGDR